MSVLDEGSIESSTAEASEAIRIEMEASGHGRNYYAQGDMTFIHNLRDVIRSERIASTRLTDATRYFVEPAGFQDALVKLTKHHVVVLCGPVETGRHTAALALFDRLNLLRQGAVTPRPLLTVGELVPDWSDPDVHRLPLTPSSGYLLELARAGDTRPSIDFGRELVEHSSSLEDEDTFLIVLATPEEWKDCRGTATPVTVDLSPSAAAQIVKRRLTDQFQEPQRLRHLATDLFAEILGADLRPANAVRLAEAIGEAADTDEAMRQVADRFQGWTSYLAEWFHHNQSVGDRARLIAAAMLGTAPDHEILDAADELLKILNLKREVEGPLSGPDLSQQLKALNAERVGNALSITASRPRLDAAVLDHVWIERPKFRPMFSKWVIQITATATPKRVNRIASQLVGLAVRQAPSAFLDVIEAWSAGTSARRKLAAEMLAETVLDRKVGRAVREKMATWSKASGTSQHLRDLIAQVCGSTLATEKPEVAMTRLRDLLTKPGYKPQAAIEAVLMIAALPDLAATTLHRVREWMDGQALAAGAKAFLAMMNIEGIGDADTCLVPRLLTGDDVVLDHLRTGWNIVATLPEHRRAVEETMIAWLDAADAGHLDTTQVLSVFVPVLVERFDRSLVGSVTTTTRMRQGPDLFAVPARRQLLEAVVWRSEAPATADAGLDHARLQ